MLKKVHTHSKKDIDVMHVLYETAHAEYGSALEMLAACKKSKNSSTAFGYFYHSKDEYIHTSLFFKLLSDRGKKFSSKEANLFRFSKSSILV